MATTIVVKPWLAQDRGLLTRELVGDVTRRTAKAIQFTGSAVLRESRYCLRCGKEIVNPASILVGYGPWCSEQIGIDHPGRLQGPERQAVLDEIARKTRIENVWFPLSALESIVEDEPPPGAPAPVKPVVEEPPPLVTRATVQGAYIVVTTSRYDQGRVDACREVKAKFGGTWNRPYAGGWNYPARSDVAVFIAETMGAALQMDEAFAALCGEADRQRERTAEALALKAVADDALTAIPFTRSTPRSYQVRAFNMAREQDYILAMEPGTGKSAVVAYIAANQQYKRVLIVGPKAVVPHWPGQLAFHAGLTRTLALCNTPETKNLTVAKKTALAQAFLEATPADEPAIVVVNYAMLICPPFGPSYSRKEVIERGKKVTRRVRVEDGWLLTQQWDLVVFDEVQDIRNAGTRTAMMAGELTASTQRVKHVLGLTGTPFYNSQLDAYGICKAVLRPNPFGTSFERFREHYAYLKDMGSYQIVTGYKNERELNHLFYQRAFKVTLAEAAPEIPEPIHQTRRCELTSEGRTMYRKLSSEYVVDYLGTEAEESEATKRFKALEAQARSLVAEGRESEMDYEALEVARQDAQKAHRVTVMARIALGNKLAQIANGHVKLDNGETVFVDTGKVEGLNDVLSEVGPDEPLVVFYGYNADREIITRACQAQGRTTAELSGRVSELDKFQRGEVNTIIVQIGAGGAGVELTRCGARLCRYVCYYTHCYAPGKYEQSLARNHRIGQTEVVVYYHLVVEDTVDERILAKLEEKTANIARVKDDPASERAIIDELVNEVLGRRGPSYTVDADADCIEDLDEVA